MPNYNFVYLHGFAAEPGSYKAQYFNRKFAQLQLTLHSPDLSQGDIFHFAASREYEADQLWVKLVELEDDHALAQTLPDIWGQIQDFCTD